MARVDVRLDPPIQTCHKLLASLFGCCALQPLELKRLLQLAHFAFPSFQHLAGQGISKAETDKLRYVFGFEVRQIQPRVPAVFHNQRAL